MPNVGGREYPYTPAGMAAAKQARAKLGAQVTDAERRRLAKRKKLRDRLGMKLRPTSASRTQFGDFSV